MDPPSGDPGALDTVQAASELANLLDPQPQQTPSEEPAATEPEKDGDKPTDEPVAQEDAPAEPAKFTVKVDGKDVELTEAEIADAYKNGLRQADYTRKTMEAADQRKAAEAEASKAREERTKYAHGLQQAHSLL